MGWLNTASSAASVYDRLERFRAGSVHRGDNASTPSTSLQMVTLDASTAAATAVAVRSEPPRPSNANPVLVTPYHPVMTGMEPVGSCSDSLVRAASTRASSPRPMRRIPMSSDQAGIAGIPRASRAAAIAKLESRSPHASASARTSISGNSRYDSRQLDR